MYTEEVTTVEYDVPADSEPAATCPYCDRPFRSERYAIFHVGNSHPDQCAPDERTAFDDERDDEEYDLLTFHVKAAVSVFLVYFMFSFMYALVWAG